ncbi:ABC transporter substrate-binding protein [Marinobacterium jannaschii]|uniref:ABC transporter substrate-binding protein n=1 Tax=Marinobacterium jannaschii TaxID=64970 RepID=UPI000489CD41|nr:ABC transporter substrate-binding protein [Marinobacterium jannaschii]
MFKLSLFRNTGWALCLLFAANVFAAPEKPRPIKIGTFLSESGAYAWHGLPAIESIRLYVQRINQQGGIHGRPIELIHFNTRSSVRLARESVRRLINDHNVDILLGGSNSGAAVSVIPLAEKARIPYIALAGSSAIVDPVKRWVFKTPHTDQMVVDKIFSDMKQRGIRRIGLISSSADFGRSGRKQAITMAAGFGIEIAVDEHYAPRVLSVSEQVGKIARTPDLQALLVFSSGAGAAMVTREVRQAGIELPLYESQGVASDIFLKLAGDAAEGIRFPAPALLLSGKMRFPVAQQRVIDDYTKHFEAAYDKPVSVFGGHAYDGLMLALNAIRRAGTTESEAVRQALESTRGFISTSGPVNMSSLDHLGIGLSMFPMIEIRNGRFSALERPSTAWLH